MGSRRDGSSLPGARAARRLGAVAALAFLPLLPGCASGIGSIGAVLGLDHDTHALHVREAPEGLPARKAGVLPGDEVVMIEGFYVRDLGSKQIRALLRGEVGSKVELTVVRGSEVRRVHIERGALKAPDKVQPREERIE